MQVRADDLRHGFRGTHELFGGLSFEISAGDLVALTGPSGSGKSTLLSLLARWERPNCGKIFWDSVDSIGWVFQNPYGVPKRSAIDHVCVPLLAHGLSRASARKEAARIMDRFELDSLADRSFSALSGGEAQRLMLARAVAKKPDLLLVDEPTAQLDHVASATVNGVLKELANDEMIVVVATHDPETAAACHSRLTLGIGAEPGFFKQ